MKIETTLSGRGLELKNKSGVIDKFKAILSDPYDPDKNPDGFVNLGVAENFIMLDENASFINKKLQVSPFDFSYGSGPWGSPRLLAAMANHMKQYFKPHQNVKPEEIHFANGVTSLCEMLGFALCDENDYILLSRPIYQAFKQDFGTKARVNCEYVAFGDIDQFSTDCVSQYEIAIVTAALANRRIRALILCNPHNPLGKCYTKEALIDLLKMCNKYKVHLIVDEIYALSVYEVPDNHAIPFTSVLSLDTDQYIDSQYLHHLYGFSKDFAAGGIRIGCCYTRNKDLKKALEVVSPFSWSGNVNEKMACLILEDEKYLTHFLDLSHKRLSSNNVLTRKLLDKHDIGYVKGANAGFFMWIDLRPWLPKVESDDDRWKAEDMLTGKMIENKVFFTNGKEMEAEEPGWYRLIFAQDPRAVQEGVKRLAKLLKG